MHHRTFLLTACFLGGTSLAAAESSTSTTLFISTSKKPSFDSGPRPTALPKITKVRKSHNTDPEYIAFRQYTEEQEFNKGADDTEAEFREQLENDRDVDVDAFVTILPSSIQPYMRSYYSQEVSIVNVIRAGTASEPMMPTTTKMAMHETKTITGISTGKGTDSSTATNTNSKSSRHKPIAMETISMYPTKEPSTATAALYPNLTNAPLSLRRSSSPSSSSPSTISDPGTIGTIGPSPSTPLPALPNAAAAGTTRQAMAGVLGKTAGAFTFAIVGLVVLL